jgi:hypothetical protein
MYIENTKIHVNDAFSTRVSNNGNSSLNVISIKF